MFDPSWLDEVPPFEAPRGMSEEVGRALDHGYAILEERNEIELFSAYAWTVLASDRNEQLEELETRFPFTQRVSFGYFDPEIEEATGFGFIVEVDPPSDLLRIGLAEEYTDQTTIELAGERFPVSVRIVRDRPQANVTRPGKAKASVWTAINPTGARPREGWLMPRHAVRPRRSRIAYSDGCTGLVVDDFGPSWDAVLASSTLPTPPTTQATALDVLPPGLSLKLRTRRGVRVNTVVVHVERNIGLIGYDKSPIRMTYDWSGSKRGDSGALVSAVNGHEPVAMHQGSAQMRDLSGAFLLHNGTRVTRAFGLCLFQIQAVKRGVFYV